MTKQKEDVLRIFEEKFQQYPDLIINSPGRINIMGEHTDYNEGFVLPAAINYGIHAAFSKKKDGQCNLYSIDYGELQHYSLDEISKVDVQWANFILGVVDQLSSKIGGFNMVFTGDIPKGAGLSSSAALCCATVFGVSGLFDLRLDLWEMVKIAQKSEHTFADVQCGIMDQFACLFGVENHLLKLNCHTLDYQKVKFDMTGFQFILINSNVPHQLKDSAYNDRRTESREAVECIASGETNVSTYQDIDLSRVDAYKSQLSELQYRRARHIVTENQRVHDISKALVDQKFEEAGRILTASHQSQKADYEITCEQTDFLVDQLLKEEAILGARQVGGGFGGCILSIAKDTDLAEILNNIDADYHQKYGLSFTQIPIKISGGCAVDDSQA